MAKDIPATLCVRFLCAFDTPDMRRLVEMIKEIKHLVRRDSEDRHGEGIDEILVLGNNGIAVVIGERVSKLPLDEDGFRFKGVLQHLIKVTEMFTVHLDLEGFGDHAGAVSFGGGGAAVGKMKVRDVFVAEFGVDRASDEVLDGVVVGLRGVDAVEPAWAGNIPNIGGKSV